ncbi:MAG: hypothetical protein WC070_04820 [Candidatus Magasanikbacteria bacterium]
MNNDLQIKKIIQNNNFSEVEIKLRKIIIDPVAKDVFWGILDEDYSFADNKKIQNDWWKLYRMYVEICWKKMPMLHIEFVNNHLFAKQLVIASVLKFEPIETLLNYLGSRFLLEEEQMSEYKKIKESIFNSNIVLGTYKGKNVIQKELIQEITELNSKSNPTLELANLKAKLEEIFFSNFPNDLNFDNFFVNKREVVVTFFSFVHFLIGVQPKSISRFIDLYFNGKEILNKSEFSNINNALDEIVNLDTDIVENIENNEDLLSNSTSNLDNKYLQIKSQLEQQFSYDENGELTPIEEVLNILSQMAEEQGDVNIEELYMFDENAGKFVWNEELTNAK